MDLSHHRTSLTCFISAKSLKAVNIRGGLASFRVSSPVSVGIQESAEMGLRRGYFSAAPLHRVQIRMKRQASKSRIGLQSPEEETGTELFFFTQRYLQVHCDE